MGIGVLIIGNSGCGKSASLRNFSKGEIGVFNVTSKPLPFRNNLDTVNKATYKTIKKSLENNALNAYVIDDAGYLLAFDNFSRAQENGYTKFVDMAVSFENMLEAIINTSDDTVVYVMMHIDHDFKGRAKPKLVGKMLDEKLCVEGLFSIVLVADNDESGYWFETKSDGTHPAKTPIGMFDESRIENDLKAVDTTIREYYGLQKIGGKSE